LAYGFRAVRNILTLFAAFAISVAHAGPRARDLGVPFEGRPGPVNAITDVAGVTVGQVTLIEDLADGRKNKVTGTPTWFVDGVRYDGAWDFHSMLEALERPLARRVHRSARVFASLPTSAGLVLLVASAVAILCANTPLMAIYQRVMDAPMGIGPISGMLSLTVRDWLSEGLLAVFFLLVGLEIRREMTVGALATRRAATLPVVAAIGHETDITLTDLVADVRAATPSAAAETVVPDRRDQAVRLRAVARRLDIGLRARVELGAQRLERTGDRLSAGVTSAVARARARCDRAAATLEALSPLRVLGRGYAVARDGAGRVLARVADFRLGEPFRLTVQDGDVGARVQGPAV